MLSIRRTSLVFHRRGGARGSRRRRAHHRRRALAPARQRRDRQRGHGAVLSQQGDDRAVVRALPLAGRARSAGAVSGAVRRDAHGAADEVRRAVRPARRPPRRGRAPRRARIRSRARHASSDRHRSEIREIFDLFSDLACPRTARTPCGRGSHFARLKDAMSDRERGEGSRMGPNVAAPRPTRRRPQIAAQRPP